MDTVSSGWHGGSKALTLLSATEGTTEELYWADGNLPPNAFLKPLMVYRLSLDSE
jgi:hypothetical protein